MSTTRYSSTGPVTGLSPCARARCADNRPSSLECHAALRSRALAEVHDSAVADRPGRRHRRALRGDAAMLERAFDCSMGSLDGCKLAAGKTLATLDKASRAWALQHSNRSGACGACCGIDSRQRELRDRHRNPYGVRTGRLDAAPSAESGGSSAAAIDAVDAHRQRGTQDPTAGAGKRRNEHGPGLVRLRRPGRPRRE